MWIRGGGKTLIHKMWIKRLVFFIEPSLTSPPCIQSSSPLQPWSVKTSLTPPVTATILPQVIPPIPPVKYPLPSPPVTTPCSFPPSCTPVKAKKVWPWAAQNLDQDLNSRVTILLQTYPAKADG